MPISRIFIGKSVYREPEVIAAVTVFTLVASTGSFSNTGSDVTLTYNPTATEYTLTADSSSNQLIGGNSALLTNKLVSADSSSNQLIGSNSALLTNKLVSAASSSNQLIGSDTTLSYLSSIGLTADPSSNQLIGSDNSLLYHRITEVGYSNNQLIGNDVTLSYLSSTGLTASPSSNQLIGSDVTLLTHYTLSLETTANACIGTDNSLITNYLLDSESADNQLIGSNASLSLGQKSVSAEASSNQLIGEDTNLVVVNVNSILAGQGNYTVSGSNASLLAHLKESVEPSLYTNVFEDAALYVNYLVSAESFANSISVTDITLQYNQLLSIDAEPGSNLLVGSNSFLTPSFESIVYLYTVDITEDTYNVSISEYINYNFNILEN